MCDVGKQAKLIISSLFIAVCPDLFLKYWHSFIITKKALPGTIYSIIIIYLIYHMFWNLYQYLMKFYLFSWSVSWLVLFNYALARSALYRHGFSYGLI